MKTALLVAAVAIAEQAATINIGLRDHSVIEDVPVLAGQLPRQALDVLGVVVGRDSLRAARTRLGATALRDQGAPHDALGICYAVPSADATLFLETGELEQGATDAQPVDSFVLLRGASPGCRRLSVKHLSTRSGLRLGLTARQVEAQLGTPSTRSEKLLLYVFKTAGKIGVAEVHLQHAMVTQLVVGEWPDE